MNIIVGTGKSVTGAHIAYVFAMSNRELKKKESQFVLYCGPSNKSVDVVFGKCYDIFVMITEFVSKSNLH